MENREVISLQEKGASFSWSDVYKTPASSVEGPLPIKQTGGLPEGLSKVWSVPSHMSPSLFPSLASLR